MKTIDKIACVSLCILTGFFCYQAGLKKGRSEVVQPINLTYVIKCTNAPATNFIWFGVFGTNNLTVTNTFLRVMKQQ